MPSAATSGTIPSEAVQEALATSVSQALTDGTFGPAAVPATASMMMREAVIRMGFVAVLMTVMVACLAVAAWSAIKEEANDDKARSAPDSGRAREAPKPETLEGALVRQLMKREISGRQYRRAMQGLAERDDDRHPLTIPPEN